MFMSTTRYINSAEVLQFTGHDAIVDPAPVVHIDAPVTTDSVQLEGLQTIHMGVADTDKPQGVVIAPVSWSDYSKRPFQQLRLGAMARFGNVRVIGLDFPGMGDVEGGRGNELTERQLEEAQKGRLQDLASNYWSALDSEKLLDDANGNPLPMALWGHSLSTLTVAELAASLPDGREIDDLYVSEAMALGRTTVRHLARVFLTKAGKDLGRYQAMNEGALDYEDAGITGLVRQVVRQSAAHYVSIQALSGGMHSKIIEQAYVSGKLGEGAESATHAMVRAERGIGLVEAFDQLSKNLKDIKPTNQARVLKGEYHGYQDSMPAVLAEMTHLTIVQAQS